MRVLSRMVCSVGVCAPFAGQLLAAPSITVGNVQLKADTPNQVVQIFVTGGDLVQGLDFRVQVADGGPDVTGMGSSPTGPIITGNDILTGTIFSSNNSGAIDPGSYPQYSERDVSTNPNTFPNDKVAASGLLATLTFDTTGFKTRGQTFTLNLSNTAGGDTDFGTIIPVITNGSITIVGSLVWNQVGGTWDTNAANKPWLLSGTSTASAFTTNDYVNFTNAAVGAVNIAAAGVTPTDTAVSNTTGTYTFNGGGILGGTLTKTGTGSLLLANAANTFSAATISAGTVTVGNASGNASSALTVNGALNIANLAKVSLSPSTAGVGTNGALVHHVGSLALNSTGILDLNNNAVVIGTTTPVATVRQYLINGYSNGNWNGTSGGGITSTWAANDASKRTAVGYVAQPNGTTLVAATLYGDTTLKGSVGLSDYNTLAANFNKPGVWSQGDFNYDGTVGLSDYNLLAANFNKHAQPGGGVAVAGAGGAAKAASVTLTSGSASPAASTLPDGVVDPGTGNVALEANPNTGQLYLVGHDSNINSYEVDSAAGKLTFVSQKNPGGYNTLTSQTTTANLPGSNNPSEDVWAIISSQAGTFVAEAYPASDIPGYDIIGPGLQVFDLNKSGLSAWTAGTPISDLTFKYGNGTGATFTPAVINLVPEPTCLALAGIAAGGLLSRRRRTS